MHKSKLRVGALIVAATVIGGAMIIPAGAADGVSRAFVRRTVKKFINRDNNKNEGIFASFNNGPGIVPTGIATIASRSVPKGNYAIFGKVTIRDAGDLDTECLIQAGADFDHGWARVEANSSLAASGVTLNLEVVHSFGAGGGPILLRCDDHGDADDWEDAKIIAIRQPKLRNTVSPAFAGTSAQDPDDA